MSSSELDAAAERAGAAAPLAAPVARAVADDLESIFPDEAAPGGTVPRKLRLGLAREPRARGRERRLATVGAMIAATCVGVSAGALFARTAAPSKPAPPPASPGVPIALAALPSPGPLPARAPLAPQAAEFAPALDPSPPKLQRTTAARTTAPHRGKSRAAARCGRSSRCGSGGVMAADARLRRAYASAERAGVSRAVLADYRSEWSRLRRRAPRNPSLVAARYRQMASELSRAAAHRHVAHAAPPRSGPFERLRMQMAALWR